MTIPFLKRRRGWVLLVAAIPAFTGMPLDRFEQQLVPGIAWSWTMYWVGVNALVRHLYGARIFGRFLAVTVLVTLPVVFTGGLVSFVQAIIEGNLSHRQPIFSIHYVKLCMNMLTIMPLSLGLAAALPVNRIEGQLLARTTGVSLWEKQLLMALRVFHHIVFAVIPQILEVIREERMLRMNRLKDPSGSRPGWHRRLRFTLKSIIHVGVEGISAATQYVPLWAMEIARLPNRTRPKN